jgi:hypothetical protein
MKIRPAKSEDYEAYCALVAEVVPQANDPRSTPMLAELSQIFTKLSENGKVAMLYEAKIYCGRIS